MDQYGHSEGVRRVPASGECYQVEVRGGLADVPIDAWNRLLEPDDAPLLSWEYLQGLEQAGCVGEGTSWHPLHVLIWRCESSSDDIARGQVEPQVAELVAAAPAYAKTDSDGEWVFDLDWAAFAEEHGLGFYPKLVCAVPFNPVGGGRLLTQPGLEAATRAHLRRLLLVALVQVGETAGLYSANILFHRPGTELNRSLTQTGFLLRQQEQYHFLNRGYASFDDFLMQMKGHRRTSIRRERRALVDAGITVRTYRGGQGPLSFTFDQLDNLYDLYVGTSQRYTGASPYLNRRFFHLCHQRLGDRLELVLAHDRDGAMLGGAWNLRGDTRLYGRYWGQAHHVPFLHFEVCYYHSVERCIAEGLAAFEPGHGGEHKLLRGFTPVLTHSAHYLRDQRLRRPIAAFLRQESALVDDLLRASTLRCPLRLPRLADVPEGRKGPRKD